VNNRGTTIRLHTDRIKIAVESQKFSAAGEAGR
jgi:hypothetical protein